MPRCRAAAMVLTMDDAATLVARCWRNRAKRRLLRMWIGMTDHRRRQLAPILADRYRYVEMGGIPKTREAA